MAPAAGGLGRSARPLARRSGTSAMISEHRLLDPLMASHAMLKRSCDLGEQFEAGVRMVHDILDARFMASRKRPRQASASAA
jgi:hypothetical protein